MLEYFKVKEVRYRVLGDLGTGGYSSVYRVSDPQQRTFALKVVKTAHIAQKELVDGFGKELALLKQLKGEIRVIKYIESDSIDNTIYIVMELGDASLDAIITGRKLELHEVRHYSREIFKCVRAIHSRGIVHSDLKPANFISVRGTLKLIDFGLSDIPAENTVNVYRKYAVGTASYMAPEMFCEQTLSLKPNKHIVNASSDVWGCGCIIYEMIYGRRIFADWEDKARAITDSKVDIDCPEKGQCFQVPDSFCKLMKSCLVRDQKYRITVGGALSSLALAETYVSAQDINGFMGRALEAVMKDVGLGKEVTKEEVLNFLEAEMKKLG